MEQISLGNNKKTKGKRAKKYGPKAPGNVAGSIFKKMVAARKKKR